MAMLEETLKYLKKSFWVLAFVAVVPALIISFFAKPFSSITFLPLLFVGQTDYHFSEIFMMMLTPISNASFWGGFVGNVLFFVLFWISCVLGVCIVEKHLKTGTLTPKTSAHQFFSYVLPILLALIMWSALYLVSAVAQSGFISLIHFICGVTPPSFIDCLLSTFISILVFGGVMYCSIHLMFMPLIMVYYGYGWRESLVESLRMTSKNYKDVLLGFGLPMVIIIGVNFVLSLVTALLIRFANLSEVARYWIDYIISVATHIMIIVYLIAYDVVAFYKLSGLERRDIKRYERRNYVN
ncbi:MAG: hypothetical protein J1F36_02380 [Clostridiales bacterium]|nr:hypothetical protein [Clostridiales bacterium]